MRLQDSMVAALFTRAQFSVPSSEHGPLGPHRFVPRRLMEVTASVPWNPAWAVEIQCTDCAFIYPQWVDDYGLIGLSRVHVLAAWLDDFIYLCNPAWKRGDPWWRQ